MERASADVGFMFVAYNLRRLINIPGYDRIYRYLKMLIFHLMTFFNAITSILNHFLNPVNFSGHLNYNFYISANSFILKGIKQNNWLLLDKLPLGNSENELHINYVQIFLLPF